MNCLQTHIKDCRFLIPKSLQYVSIFTLTYPVEWTCLLFVTISYGVRLSKSIRWCV